MQRKQRKIGIPSRPRRIVKRIIYYQKTGGAYTYLHLLLYFFIIILISAKCSWIRCKKKCKLNERQNSADGDDDERYIKSKSTRRNFSAKFIKRLDKVW